MHPNKVSLIAFLLVVGAHISGLAAAIFSSSTPKPVEIVIPTIQGMLVMAKPEKASPPAAVTPPPLEKKPAPKPAVKPPPKAPASERAIQAPEPEPSVQPETVAEAQVAPAEPAPPSVNPPRVDAGELSNPAPVYPSLSRRLREEGVVILDILIKADGTVGEVKIKQSSGYRRLDDTAIKAVKRWRYLAATQDGKTIDYWYEQPFEFNLH